MIQPSIQDFSTINTYVEKYKSDLSLRDSSSAFYFVVLDLLFNLQDDEIRDAITDSHFISTNSQKRGKDRGVDVVIIDESSERAEIHLFNFKYTTNFEKINKNFPSGEIDKITSFLNDMMSKEDSMKSTVNPILFSKVEEIWKIFESQNPNFTIHLCSNHYHGLEPSERQRFDREVNRHSNFSIQSHTIEEFVKLLTRKGKVVVDARLKAIDKKFFEKSDGDIRAMVVNIDIRDLIRIVLDSEEIRNEVDIEDYDKMKGFLILEDAFEDNVRIYLKQRSNVNKNIKKTALSEENHRFFYYNNGITITCDSFSYPKTVRSPIIDLKNIQIVNGSQTIHALYDAYMEDSQKFEELDILCRLYQTSNTTLSMKIAEYTNSQNPVKSRDIRSIDYVQQKLEQEFLALDLYYERKKNQYSSRPKGKRIDAEKSGQVLMAMFNKMPSEAKNQKRVIFAERYEDIFNDSITADKVLLAYRLFDRIEKIKNEKKSQLLDGIDDYEKSNYVSYSSYWNLYFLGELAELRNIDLSYENLEDIWVLNDNVLLLLEHLIQKERNFLDGKKEKYSHSLFFKYGKPKKHYEDMEDDEMKMVVEE